MAVPPLPKLKTLRLSKLQALLLIGGAFVLAALLWLCLRYRLVADTPSAVPGDPVFAMRLSPAAEGTKAQEARRRFMDALPPEAVEAIKLQDSALPATFFAVRDVTGRLQWGVLEALSARPADRPKASFRLIPRGTDAFGFAIIDGRKTPFSAELGVDFARFRVGRQYAGLDLDPRPFGHGRRLLRPMDQTYAYLEKPEGVSWTDAVAGLTPLLKSVAPLSSIWSLPGRLELTVSASHTDTVIQPFVLYYRPEVGETVPQKRFEGFARGLLAEARPSIIDVLLPDGSRMQEQRYDENAVQTRSIATKVGPVVHFSVPGYPEELRAFFADDREVWLSTDIGMIEAAFLGNVGASYEKSSCDEAAQAGFARLPAGTLPFKNGFRTLEFSLKNLETGLFTVCGYY